MASIEQNLQRNRQVQTEPQPQASGQAPASYGPGGEPQYPTYSRFLATPLPLIATYQPDALRQFYRGGVPQQRIFPRNG